MGCLVIGELALKQLVGWRSINVKHFSFQSALFKHGVARPLRSWNVLKNAVCQFTLKGGELTGLSPTDRKSNITLPRTSFLRRRKVGGAVKTSVTCRIPSVLVYLKNCTNYLLTHVMSVWSTSLDAHNILLFNNFFGKDDMKGYAVKCIWLVILCSPVFLALPLCSSKWKIGNTNKIAIQHFWW